MKGREEFVDRRNERRTNTPLASTPFDSDTNILFKQKIKIKITSHYTLLSLNLGYRT